MFECIHAVALFLLDCVFECCKSKVLKTTSNFSLFSFSSKPNPVTLLLFQPGPLTSLPSFFPSAGRRPSPFARPTLSRRPGFSSPLPLSHRQVEPTCQLSLLPPSGCLPVRRRAPCLPARFLSRAPSSSLPPSSPSMHSDALPPPSHFLSRNGRHRAPPSLNGRSQPRSSTAALSSPLATL